MRGGDRTEVVEYVGRADHQVKIRGFRIELGEIEARLLEAPGVRSAVVVAREAGAGRQLVGYVTGEDVDGPALQASLSDILPDYMVPSRIVVLDRLPLTPNGKIDRRALPAPEAAASGEQVAPRTATEARARGDLVGAARPASHRRHRRLLRARRRFDCRNSVGGSYPGRPQMSDLSSRRVRKQLGRATRPANRSKRLRF